MLDLCLIEGNLKMELFDIIATIESNNNLSAMRFEPAVFSKTFTANNSQLEIIKKISLLNKCSISTAEMIYSTSWGACQIMGFNIYGLGYDQSIYHFLSTLEDQKNIFEKFVTINQINFTPEYLVRDKKRRDEFAEHYNGPGNIEIYSSLIAASLKQHGFEVI
jgi:hypothetical protein